MKCSTIGCEKDMMAEEMCAHCYVRYSDSAPESPERYFWNHLSQGQLGDCWPWCGATGPTGEPMIAVDGAQIAVCDYAHELFVGGIPADLVVLHHCNNFNCVHPKHLFLGNVNDT